MTNDEALRFLAEHQPMPNTAVVSEKLLQQLNAILEHFETYLDDRCIPLLLNVFGEGDGHGVYQLVDSVILRYPVASVVPHLRLSLSNPRRCARYWATQIAAHYQHTNLIAPLLDLAVSEDSILRETSLFALSRYAADVIVPRLQGVRGRAMSQRARRDLDDLIATFSSAS